MSINFRLPNITASTEQGKLQQMQSYMYQLVEQLNWALNTVESAEGSNSPAIVYKQREPSTAQEAEDTFNSIKALIIKSADIVKAYETTIMTNFNGTYFTDSNFGTFVKETNRKVLENSEGVTETYSKVETITNADGTGALDKLQADVRETNAYIRRGLLDNGKYGIEVGETNTDGAFLKYARFTADKLSFYDSYGYEVAYIGAGCLYVEGKTVFRGEIQLGGYKTDTSDGLAFTWVG